MKNLEDRRLIWLKGGLFLGLGLLALVLLLVQLTDIRLVVLLLITIWAFCRAYYFAFYVIEGYVDPTYKFAGLLHFARYAVLGHAPDRKVGQCKSASESCRDWKTE